MSYNNPFSGNKLKVVAFFKEDELNAKTSNFDFNKIDIEDENERFILYANGVLIRKTVSEKKYFPEKE